MLCSIFLLISFIIGIIFMGSGGYPTAKYLFVSINVVYLSVKNNIPQKL